MIKRTDESDNFTSDTRTPATLNSVKSLHYILELSSVTNAIICIMKTLSWRPILPAVLKHSDAIYNGDQ